MDGIDILDGKEWHPLTRFNFTHPFFSLNAHTIIYTWVVLILLIIMAIGIRFVVTKKTSHVRYILIVGIRSLMDLTTQTVGRFSYNHCVFVTSLFIFIFLCNTVAVIPFVEEATKDLNTTLALGIIAFLYVQYYSIITHGFIEYLKEFTTPIFLMAPLHIISKISSVVSMSFRLFGNIFGSGLILHIYTLLQEKSILFQLVGLLGLNLLMTAFFILFEGFLQAFVFTMLALTYLGIAVTHEDNPSEQTHA